MANSIIILSGPSAVGKTTVVEKLLEKKKNFGRIITCTSRKPRKEKENYIFLKKKAFEQKIANALFLEYSVVYDNYYGILKTQFEEAYKKYCYSLVVLDTVGSKKLMDYCKAEKIACFSIFLSLVNPESVEKRLLNREKKALYPSNNIQARLQSIPLEFHSAKNFDKQIYNYNLEDCILEIEQFICKK